MTNQGFVLSCNLRAASLCSARSKSQPFLRSSAKPGRSANAEARLVNLPGEKTSATSVVSWHSPQMFVNALISCMIWSIINCLCGLSSCSSSSSGALLLLSCIGGFGVVDEEALLVALLGVIEGAIPIRSGNWTGLGTLPSIGSPPGSPSEDFV